MSDRLPPPPPPPPPPPEPPLGASPSSAPDHHAPPAFAEPAVTTRSSGLPWVVLALGLVAVAIVAAFVFGPDRSSRPPDDAWAIHTDATTGIRVDLPGRPVTERESIPVLGGSIDVVSHGVERRDATWGIGIYLLSEGDTFDLDLSLEGAADAVDGDVVAYEYTTSHQFPAIDGEIEFEERGRDWVGFLRVIRLDGRNIAVMLQGIAPLDEREMIEETFERLADSFTP